MCTGIETAAIISAIGATAGAGMSMASAADARSNMNRVTEQQLAATQALQKKATPIYQANLEQSTGPKAQEVMQTAEQQALADYKKYAEAQQHDATNPLENSRERLAQSRNAAEVQRAQGASAALQKYPALGNAWMQGNINTNARLGNVTSQVDSLGMAYPALMSNAQHSGDTGQSIGSLIGTVSQLGGTYAMSQGAFNTPARRANVKASYIDNPTNPSYPYANLS